jgi:hypothetical protein
MNHNGEQFSGLVGVHPAGSKPKTKGNGAEHWGAPLRERLADSVNSARGVGMENVKVTRPAPGGAWGIPDKYKD